MVQRLVMTKEKEELIDSMLAALIQDVCHQFDLDDDSDALKLIDKSIERERAYYES